jgi:ADP-ribosyl-[dinitrogen reductase] hydrolase
MDYKCGAIFGALIGDAIGAPLEFYPAKITPKIVDAALKLPGGGVLNVGPGQFTDDGELTLALLHALRPEKFDVEAIAKNYIEWHQSFPFDMGQTCGRALGFATDATSMMANAKKYNEWSEANGSLMRATPIGVIYHESPYATIAAYARLDSSLTHPNKACQDVCALYSVAIAYLINNPGDHLGAIALVESMPDIDPKVKEWLHLDGANYNCTINIGHVKHAFVLAFHFLRAKASYVDSIQHTLLLGGDTDTNACIVGGLIGALHGISNIPRDMVDKVLVAEQGHIRPVKYSARVAMQLMQAKTACPRRPCPALA